MNCNNTTSVTTTTENSTVVTIVTPGPQGPQGPSGSQGPSGTVDSGSLLITASIDSNTITFEKGDGSTFDIEVNNVTSSISSSYALTASYLSGYIEPFPYTGSAIISGSLTITGSTDISGSLTASSLTTPQGTINQLTASHAITASYALNAGGNSDPFPYTGSAEITGSLGVTGSITSTQLGVGAPPDGTTRLDVRAQGALISDTIFRVRNSANTANIIEILGNNYTNIFGPLWLKGTSRVIYFGNPANGSINFSSNRLIAGATSGHIWNVGGEKLRIESSYLRCLTNVGIGSGTTFGTSATNTLRIDNGTSPNTSISNAFQLYSADITAGNAAPHFITEDGSIIKLYQQPSVTSSQGIADVLTNVGLLSGVSVIESTFPYTGSAIISGSLTITGSTDISGSLTASLLTTPQGTINQLTSSYAITASHALNAGGGSGFPFVGDAVITGSLIVSSSNNTSSLTLYGSGSNPVFIVQGSAGELFSISDSLSGSLFAVNNEFGLPILETFSDDRTLIGTYTARSLYTTAVIASSDSSITQSLYSISTGSDYDGAFFEYTAKSASNARAGTITAVWSESVVQYTETTTADIGSTSGVELLVEQSQSSYHLHLNTPTNGWKVKTIVRSI